MPSNSNRKVLIIFLLTVQGMIVISLCSYFDISWNRQQKINNHQGTDAPSHPDPNQIPPNRTHGNNTLPECSLNMSSLDTSLVVDKELITMNKVEVLLGNSSIASGGYWQPPSCKSSHRVAIIIPFRDREHHLSVFLRHMHPLLQKQLLDYGIFVIEQGPKKNFNRALLFNVGFVETNKLYDWQCYIFHDVDLLPESALNLYTCPTENPRHMVVGHEGINYRLYYETSFGGVSAMTRSQFERINGFSNAFYGWGGEDDDAWNRIVHHGLKVNRYPTNVGRYSVLSHARAEFGPQRMQLVETGKERFATDGLNSLVYNVTNIKVNKLYTKISIEIPN